MAAIDDDDAGTPADGKAAGEQFASDERGASGGDMDAFASSAAAHDALADGGFDFQAIEPLSTRYIEIFRGANALEFGATTLGGAVNFISYTGHDSSPLAARFEYGSFDSYRAQISSGGV